MRTFAEARRDLLDDFSRIGWSVKKDLKVPHATSPDGKVRFWFKPQAVYYSVVYDERVGRHDFGNARTLSYDQDIRVMSIDDIIRRVRL